MPWKQGSAANAPSNPAITPLPPVVPTAAEKAANQNLAIMSEIHTPATVSPGVQQPISATSIKTRQ